MQILDKRIKNIDGSYSEIFIEIDLEDAIEIKLDRMATSLRTEKHNLGVTDVDLENWRDRSVVPISAEKEVLVNLFFDARANHEEKKALIKASTTPEEAMAINW